MFAAQGQHLVFLAFFAGGLVSGLIYELLYFARAMFAFRRWAEIVADLVFMAAAGVMVLVVAAKSSYGQIRLYSVLSYIFGYFLEYGTLHKHFAKLSIKVYNHFTALKNKLKQTKAVKKLLK